jgi:RNA polymerase sigma factor (sigma-70 family)
MTPDSQLLRHYAESRSEDAFAELVRRYVNLVYSAALRQVGGDAHLAQDVAQTVFTDLARKAASLSKRETLTGWLYTSTHFAAAKIVRGESRRRDREEKFMREPINEPAPDADWQKLRPVLDEAMHGLKETDREAVLLRFFENRAFTEVGAKLNLSENAARMRVERAVEKLRDLLAKRGITTAAVLASIISANAVQVAPAGLASTLVTGSFAAAGTGAMALGKIMAVTKLKLGLGALALAGVITAFVIQHRASETLRAENESVTRQITEIQVNPASGSNLSAADASTNLSGRELDELLKLRAQATQLQAAQKLPIAATPTNDAPDATNITINLRIKFVSMRAGDVQSLRPALAPGAAGTCVLSSEQTEFVGNALQGINGEISEGQITTISGRGAIQSMTSAFSIDGTNANVGTTLDVTPYYSPASSLFNLNLAAQFTQLTGNPSQPGLQTIQVPTNQVALLAGQTVVFQRDIPAGGWMPDETDKPDGPRTLLVFITPTLISAMESSSASLSAEASREAAIQKMSDAKQGVLALILYASENQGQFPTNLTQAAAFLKDGFGDEIATNFDLVCPPSQTNIESPSTTIVLREKKAWQSLRGNWVKGYGFADGHVEIHSEPNGDFVDYEKNHTVLPPN